MKNNEKYYKYIKKCPVCDSQDFKKIFIKKWSQNNFIKCANCKLIFQNPRESLQKTLSRYDKNYFKYELENQYNFFNLVKKTLSDYKIIEKLKKGSRILEIGSATGLFLSYMNSLGFDSTGIEICKESVEYGKKNYKVNLLNCSLEDANLKDNSFDLIHFSHLIEHLNDPFNFLLRVNRLLKDDGLAILTTPNSKGMFAKYYNENWRCIVSDHLFLFNKNNLKLLLAKTNFKIIKYMTWGSIPKGKIFGVIKIFFDAFVKKINSGDVISFLIQKNVY